MTGEHTPYIVFLLIKLTLCMNSTFTVRRGGVQYCVLIGGQST